ncbi:hypothetical protein X798_07739, partial [Onchocerca flexuosa]
MNKDRGYGIPGIGIGKRKKEEEEEIESFNDKLWLHIDLKLLIIAHRIEQSDTHPIANDLLCSLAGENGMLMRRKVYGRKDLRNG